VLACATFPLVWVGGLVTTTDAGMAVPDWPNTYGYNLFLYPWQSWLAGPWDLFVEHGHRLLASLVGLITIGLVAVLWRSEERRWVRWLGLAALALVIFQGVLGGMRVLLDERTLAMLHGCTGPLFFAVTVALAVFTSKNWQLGPDSPPSPGGSSSLVRQLAVVTCILIYLQLVFGAVLRHVPVQTEPATFVLAIRFHLLLAAVLTVHVLLLVWIALRHFRQVSQSSRWVLLLGALLALQLALGAATWLVKFSVPAWAAPWWPAAGFTIHADGWLQTHIVTAHVATGSLMLAVSVVVALETLRRSARIAPFHQASSNRVGVAT
jgi:cytochrome c oxidase assembly protein subunit 15